MDKTRNSRISKSNKPKSNKPRRRLPLPTPPPSSSPLKGSDLGIPPPEQFEFNKNVPLSKRRQFAWLERTKTWDSLQPASDWKARKILGKGTSGLCGVFDYLGVRTSPDMPFQVVVKQCLAMDAPALHSESKLLHLLASTGTNQYVEIFPSCSIHPGTEVLGK